MRRHDVCVAWIAAQDAPFIRLVEAACRARGLSVLEVTPMSRDDCLVRLAGGEAAFGALFDRASDEDATFLPLVTWAEERGVASVNPYAQSRRAADKAATHRDLFATVRTPYTIILPPFCERAELEGLDLTPLGPTFAIKPAHGGGGDGVVVRSTSVEPVRQARQQYPQDSYLLQSHVVPAQLEGRAAWFRVIYAAGRVYPFWWDLRTHVYTPVTVAEEAHWGLRPVQEMARRIAEICGLGLFSTEIARQADGEFLVVDYVNDPLDLRPQSLIPNGVPDQVLRFIADGIAGWVAGSRPV